jgi:hypothetical protein
VSGLALLAGGTAVAAVAGGRHSPFATALLGLLALGMAHALLDELRRQARRRPKGGWATQDTVNTLLLSAWTAGALAGTVLIGAPLRVRAVGGALTLAYAAICGFFVVERRRTLAGQTGQTTLIGGTGIPDVSGSTAGSGTQSTPSIAGQSQSS